MIVRIKDGKEVLMRKLEQADGKQLHKYCHNLSPSSKQKFSPHPFDWATIQSICNNLDGKTISYIAELLESNEIIAYFIIRLEVSLNDKNRLKPNPIGDEKLCSFAPSVADEYQGRGLGRAMFALIIQKLMDTDRSKVILLGGVQKGNQKAIAYYKKLGFTMEDEFDRNGVKNYSMSLILRHL
jgi:diamine N-acetyltransferase